MERQDYADIHRAGLAARSRALTQLHDVETILDGITDTIDELNRRLQTLLS